MYDLDGKEINSMEDILKAANEEFNTPDSEADNNANDGTTVSNDEVADVEGDNSAEADDSNTETVATYTPNLVYKVKDQELKFDDRVIPIIKTKEDEDFIRDLYTKAGGLDSYKEKLAEEARQREELAKYNEAYAKKIEESQAFFNELVEARNSKNIRGLAKSLGVSEQDLLAAALEIAAEQEMPEAQRRVIQSNRENEEQLRKLKGYKEETDNALLQYMKQIDEREAKRANDDLARSQTEELNAKISSKYSELNETMKSLDMSLFDEVVSTGQKLFSETNKPVSVDDALEATVKKYSKLSQYKPQEPAHKQIVRKDSIPVVEGGSSSPVSTKAPESFDDIKAELERMKNKL